jgi:hypothetical protein
LTTRFGRRKRRKYKTPRTSVQLAATAAVHSAANAALTTRFGRRKRKKNTDKDKTRFVSGIVNDRYEKTLCP